MDTARSPEEASVAELLGSAEHCQNRNHCGVGGNAASSEQLFNFGKAKPENISKMLAFCLARTGEDQNQKKP